MLRLHSAQEFCDYLHAPLNPSDRDLFTRARQLTRQHFGQTMELYTPLYLSNHCENSCLYCGFHAQRNQRRVTLNQQEIEAEARAIAASGHGSLLLLCGESRHHVPPEYLEMAIRTCRPFFSFLAMEIYPLQTDEYAALYRAGLDAITLYQETYQPERYAELHPAGPKRDFQFRFEAPSRILDAGIPFLSLGVLLGLAEPSADLLCLFSHLKSLMHQFPAADISVSFPRLNPVAGDTARYFAVSDEMLQKIIVLTRLQFPRTGIILSTRESERFRNQVLDFGITRMSAASRTTVGGHASPGASDSQFAVRDERTLDQVRQDLISHGFEPLCHSWHNLVQA